MVEHGHYREYNDNVKNNHNWYQSGTIRKSATLKM